MRWKTGTVLAAAMFCMSSAWAEVLVLKDNYYIADAQIVRNDHGTVIYRKNNQTYQIQSDLIVKVEYKIPAGGEPYEEQEWDPGDASGDMEHAEASGLEPEQDGAWQEAPAAARIPKPAARPVKKHSITVGFLQGGGSLVGADFEFLLGDSIAGLQFGGGLLGYDVGLNFHFRPTVHSHYLSLSFWNQGGGDTYAQYLGLTFGWRAFGWLNAQLGLGATVAMSPQMRAGLSGQETGDVPPVILLYCLGAYF